MKKFSLILFFTLTATFLQAQVNKTKTFLYANAGLNLATFYQSTPKTEAELAFRNIFVPEGGISIRAEYPTLIGFETGLNFSQKGTRLKSSDSLGDTRYKLNYVTAFFDGLYYFQLHGNNNNVYAGVGLYGGYAVNGKAINDVTKTDIDFDGETWKKFDLGLQLKTGLSLNDKLTVGVNYDLAFLKTLTTKDLAGNENNCRNSILTVSLGIRLLKF